MTSFPHHYGLYGVNVHTNRVLEGLSTPLHEAPVLRVEFRGGLVEAPSATPFHANALETIWHLDDSHWHLQYDSPAQGYTWTASYDPEGIILRWNHPAIVDDIAPVLQGPVIAAALHMRGVPLLHACIVAVDDFAIAIMGTPGAGKSTTAAALLRAGHALVSDDIGALDLREGTLFVHSGYPRLRLFPDSARAGGWNEEELPRAFREETLGDKRFVALTAGSFRAGARPLRAVYALQPRKPGRGAAEIAPVDGVNAVRLLMDNLYSARFLDRRRMRHAFAQCVAIANVVGVRRVHAFDDLSSLPSLVEALVRDARTAHS